MEATLSLKIPKYSHPPGRWILERAFILPQIPAKPIDFAYKVMRRRGSSTQNVSIYDFNVEQAKDNLSVLEFYSADEEWLDFVSANRMGKPSIVKHDIVIGAVANDTIYRVFGLYESGLIDKETALKQLKIQKLYNQVVFCTESALLYLTFTGTLDAKEMGGR